MRQIWQEFCDAQPAPAHSQTCLSPLGTEHHKFDYCLYQSRSHLRMLLEVGPAQGETSRPGFDCDLSRREIEEMERRGGCVFIWLFPCHFNKCSIFFLSFFFFTIHQVMLGKSWFLYDSIIFLALKGMRKDLGARWLKTSFCLTRLLILMKYTCDTQSPHF